MPLSCQMCANNTVPFQAPTRALVLNHYSSVHRHDPNFNVTCEVEACSATYKTFQGLKSHIRRHHKGFDFHCQEVENNLVAPNEDEEMLDLADDNDSNDNTNSDDQIPEDQNNVDSDLESDTEENFLKQNALFLLKTKEFHNLTQKATDSIVADTTHIVRSSIEIFSKEVEKKLYAAGIGCDDIPGLQELLKDDHHMSNSPFSGLQGKHQQ